jgi:sulfotransferase
MATIFFQSSMPRAGSTLLQNIFAQHPEIYATPTSGVLELLYSARQTYNSLDEFKAQDSKVMDEGLIGFCNEGIHGWYENITDKEYVVDKSRGWGIHYDFLETVLEYSPKIICMVRDLRQIISSMEKKFRENPLAHDPIVNWGEMSGTTVEKRANIWLQAQPVGLALERFDEIIKRGWDKKMLFVKFEDLTKTPAEQMERIYEYLNIDSYDHDFKNVKQVTQEDDTVYGIYGDHKINPVVSELPQDYVKVLGARTCDYIKEVGSLYFDYFKY